MAHGLIVGCFTLLAGLPPTLAVAAWLWHRGRP